MPVQTERERERREGEGREREREREREMSVCMSVGRLVGWLVALSFFLSSMLQE